MNEAVADVATAIARGRRQRQEDAVIADFAEGADSGFAVLSDGMGGHDDGDLASRIIVSEVFGTFSVSSRSRTSGHDDIGARLRNAVLTANQSLRDQVDAGFGQEGMGGTVVTAVVQNDNLRWISIGDSGLYLFRSNILSRLNEIHSMAPQIDLMVRNGMMNEETARNHPDRSCLTSALVGAEIQRIDCPADPFKLEFGDIVLMASDGLEVLSEDQLHSILCANQSRSSQQIAHALMDAVALTDAPEQDNVSIVVIKPQLATVARDGWIKAQPDNATPWARFRGGFESLRDKIALPFTGRSAP